MDDPGSAERTPPAVALVRGGPRTPEGRAVSARNATRHGLAARSVVLPGVESPEAWEQHREAVVTSLAPRGAAETVLAERVAELLWRLQRAGTAESAMAAGELAGAECTAVREALAADRAWALGVPGEVTLPVGTVIPVDRDTLAMQDITAVAGVQAGDEAPVFLRAAHTLAELRACADMARATDAALKAMMLDDPTAGVTDAVARDVVTVMVGVAGLRGEASTEVRLATPDDYLRAVTPSSAKGLGKRLAAMHGRKADQVAPPAAWTLPVLALAAERMSARSGGKLAPLSIIVMSLGAIRHACNRATRVLADAQRRMDLATATATTGGTGGETVRRFEAHLQRQLAATLTTLRTLAAARPAPPSTVLSDEELNRRIARLTAKARGLDGGGGNDNEGDTVPVPEQPAVARAG